VTSLAGQHLRAAVWWAKDRSLTAPVFVDEVRRAMDALARLPNAGVVATETGDPGVLRLFVHRIHYYVDYRVKSDEVQILALLPEAWVDHPPI
jgi:plasmid stabilization system protein ParE